MNIRDIKITAKCMLLNGYAKNFKSILDMQTINFTTHKDLLVIALSGNGTGKSTLHKELLYFAMTGESSQKGEDIDELINTQAKKHMLVGLQWFFCGEYYQVERGRNKGKTTLFSIKRLNKEDEWVEIKDLPVSSRDRQTYLYSLMGLEKSYARTLINSTILLGGDTFKSFLGMPLADRRNILDPVFDTLICTSMSKELKLEQKEVMIEQAQTLREINHLTTGVALSEQRVQHLLEKKRTLESDYNLAIKPLEDSLVSCQLALENASQLDTDGSVLKDTCMESVKVLMEECSQLGVKLTKDIDALGEFKVDESDSVLVKLNYYINEVSLKIKVQQSNVDKRKEALCGEVETTIAEANSKLAQEHERFKITKAQLEDVNKKEIITGETTIKLLEEGLDSLRETHAELELEYKESLSNAEYCINSALEAETLGKKYQTNIDKLIAVANSFTTKIEVEQENVNNLTSEGDCPTCKQHVSADWVEACKVSIQEKIVGLEEERKVYDQRAIAGEAKLKDLDLKGKAQRVLETGKLRDKLQRDVSLSTTTIQNQERDIKDCKLQLDQVISGGISALASTTVRYEQEVQTLQGIIDRAEDKAKQALGEVLADLKALEASAPERIANLKQQIMDRELALSGEHGGKKSQLKEVYRLAVENIESKIVVLEEGLKRDLEGLITFKKRETERSEVSLQAKENDIKLLGKTFNDNMNEVESDIVKAQGVYKGDQTKFEGLQNTHDDQQMTIEAIGQSILVCSDQEGKADIVRSAIPKFNQSVNKYLQRLNLPITIAFDDEFNIELLESENGGAGSLFSLSMGQRARLDLAIRLSLRDVSNSKQSVNFNVLCLDEVLESLCEQGTLEAVTLLKEEFGDMNLTVISQKNSFIRDLFDDIKCYSLVNKVTTLVEVED